MTITPAAEPPAVDGRLRVAVAAPLAPELAERLVGLEPRIDLRWEPELLPPMRFPADFAGDPGFSRSDAGQRRYEDLLDGADAHFGVADNSPDGLRRAVRANPGLRWVHTMAAGGGAHVRAAALSDAELERVTFTTSAGVHAGPLAEFALLGLLAGLKQLPRLQRDQASRTWPVDRRALGMLAGSRVMIAGLGGIGREVARLLGSLGAHVEGYSRRSGGALPGLSRRVEPHELPAALGRVDAVVLALPETSATAGSIDAAFLGALRPGAILVNVGRGSVVDEASLVDALRSGRVGFAALDVFATEPLPSTSPLWDLPNVLVSPHTAALDPGEERRIVDLFASYATQLLEGEPLAKTVDTHDFY